MLLGLRTVVYYVSDLEKGKEWYNKALGVEPCFDKPFYVRYNIGGYNLGLHPDIKSEIREKDTGMIAFWGVENVEAELKRLTDLGATLRFGAEDVGEGIVLATVIDPFGNILGLINNPNFKLP